MKKTRSRRSISFFVTVLSVHWHDCWRGFSTFRPEGVSQHRDTDEDQDGKTHHAGVVAVLLHLSVSKGLTMGTGTRFQHR